MGRLTGQVVVVVGGSSGIGLATAKLARTEGASVVIASRSVEKMERVKGGVGERVQVMAVDTTDEASVRAMFDKIDRLDHLFVTAAEASFGLMAETATDALRPTLNNKVWASYYAAKYAAPKLSPGGSITFISGLLAHRPGASKGGSVAGAANAAVEAMARNLAVELAPVRVNTVLAGVIDTPLIDALLKDQREAFLATAAANLPVKRVGRPEDVADAVVFLMGNGFVTGTVLEVSGGALL